jgi:hypothetical protein
MSSFCSCNPYFCYHLPPRSPLHQFKPVCGKGMGRNRIMQRDSSYVRPSTGESVFIIDSWPSNLMFHLRVVFYLVMSASCRYQTRTSVTSGGTWKESGQGDNGCVAVRPSKNKSFSLSIDTLFSFGIAAGYWLDAHGSIPGRGKKFRTP